MNRYKLLAVSFALVLIGTLAIQAYWVVSVIEIKKKQFDDAVFSCLHATVEALEQRENITFISHFDSDTFASHAIPGGRHSKNVRMIARVGENKKTRTYSIEHTVRTDSVHRDFLEKNHPDELTQSLIFASDTMVNIKLKEKDTAAIDAKLSKIGVLIHKMAAEGRDSLLLKLPEGKEVENIVGQALKRHNISLPFRLGIKGDSKEQYQSANADSAALFSSPYRADMFPNDVLRRQGQIYLDFPDKHSYIFSNILWLLLALLVFTASLIFMFYATLSNYKKQKKLNAIKADFINNMTHELKTPLATIQVASDIILKQEGDSGSQVYQMAKAIKEQGKRMDKDVKNMLQAALLENSGHMKLHCSTFSLKEILEETRLTFRLLAAQKQVQLEIDCPRELRIEADRDLLGKALNNLLDNAIKYSSENGLVRLEARLSNGFAAITVADSGSGIAREDLPYVFDRFYRAGKGNIHYNKGYGLGLSFVKKIVELHKGKTELKSEPGKGTVITLLLPQKT